MTITNDTLKVCYVEFSTATGAGKSSIRILPWEGYGVFFTNAVKKVNLMRAEIKLIIKEAINAEDRVRVKVTREDEHDCKSIWEDIGSDKDPKEIHREILVAVKEMAYEIMFYDAMQNATLLSEARKTHSRIKKPGLKDYSVHLMNKGIAARYNVSLLRVEICHRDKLYQLSKENWDSITLSLKTVDPKLNIPKWLDEKHRWLIMEAGTNRSNNVTLKGGPVTFCEMPLVARAEDFARPRISKGLMECAQKLIREGYFEVNDLRTASYNLTARGRKLFDKMWLKDFPGI